MIGKIKKGSGFKGCVNYVLGKEQAVLLHADGVLTESRSDIIRSFCMQTGMNPDLKKPVGHIALSYSPVDAPKLTDGKMVQLAQEYMREMKITDTQYIIVRHQDREHPHVHIVFNRIDNNGKTISDRNDMYRNEQVCKKLKAKHAELCRINAVNRQLAINEDANYLRSLGDTFVTEPKNASKLMKRAKKTTVNSKGKFNKKKRFGKSIKNRCPSGFQTTIEKKFKVTGGAYIEVPNNYRASQYDHTADDYIKKKLSDRLYRLRDGTLVQRDWYSSFLLYCYDYRTQDIDKDKCITDFGRCYDKEKALIAWIKANHIKILNSGIKVA